MPTILNTCVGLSVCVASFMCWSKWESSDYHQKAEEHTGRRGSVEETKSILIFGDPGVGKSSVANMIFGENIATIETNGFQPQTMLSVQTHEGKMFKIHEVSGFNEKPLSTKDLIQIVDNLKYLMEIISTSRIHLIVLVSRAERISKTLEQNYEMFVKILAKKEVKILMVVNTCEDKTMSGEWWSENKIHYDNYDLKFDEVTVVCASQGEDMNPAFAELYKKYYQETQRSLNDAVVRNSRPGVSLSRKNVAIPEAVGTLLQNVDFVGNPIMLFFYLISKLPSFGLEFLEAFNLAGFILFKQISQNPLQIFST